MLPREHGAYFQMAFPLVTSLIVARASPPAVFFAIAVVCGFLTHEPLLLLLGGRGVRARQARGSRAPIWFATAFISMVAARPGGILVDARRRSMVVRGSARSGHVRLPWFSRRSTSRVSYAYGRSCWASAAAAAVILVSAAWLLTNPA